MNERTWDGVSGRRPSKSSISAHQSQANVPDPNNEQDKESIRYWIKFADFYEMPHITYYDSVGDLVDKLSKVTSLQLRRISDKMKEYNVVAREQLLGKWRTILTMIAKASSNAPHWMLPIAKSRSINSKSGSGVVEFGLQQAVQHLFLVYDGSAFKPSVAPCTYTVHTIANNTDTWIWWSEPLSSR